MAEETKELDAVLLEIYQAYKAGNQGLRRGIIEALSFVRQAVHEMDIDLDVPSNAQSGIKPGTMKLNAEFRRVANDNKWADRDPSVWGRSLENIVPFLKETYATWLGKGMTQADLLDVDKQAYRALRNFMDRDKQFKPEDLPLPTLPDAKLAAATDPADRFLLLVARAYERERKSDGNVAAADITSIVAESIPEQG